MNKKQEILGQYFTKVEIVKTLVDLVQQYKQYQKGVKILEPAFGTGNFITILKEKGFPNITGCEIDEDLTDNPSDFFELPLDQKFDLIIGNPPFSKYNLKESYFDIPKHFGQDIPLSAYLTKTEISKNKEKIENVFLLKSLKHLVSDQSSIAYVLPVSFFIKNRNKSVKTELLKSFSSVIIYQNDQVWFDRDIPCCFAIFSNVDSLKDKIQVIYENGQKREYTFDLSAINEELIPRVIFNKNHGLVKNQEGIALKEYLLPTNVKVKKSFITPTVTGKNILERGTIPDGGSVPDYKLAIVRVGNSSVGKCGLINVHKDVLNDMFYIFDFKPEFNGDKLLKERLCADINQSLAYFKNITCRVGSKSIKKENIFDFKVSL